MALLGGSNSNWTFLIGSVIAKVYDGIASFLSLASLRNITYKRWVVKVDLRQFSSCDLLTAHIFEPFQIPIHITELFKLVQKN